MQSTRLYMLGTNLNSSLDLAIFGLHLPEYSVSSLVRPWLSWPAFWMPITEEGECSMRRAGSCAWLI